MGSFANGKTKSGTSWLDELMANLDVEKLFTQYKAFLEENKSSDLTKGVPKENEKERE